MFFTANIHLFLLGTLACTWGGKRFLFKWGWGGLDSGDPRSVGPGSSSGFKVAILPYSSPSRGGRCWQTGPLSPQGLRNSPPLKKEFCNLSVRGKKLLERGRKYKGGVGLTRAGTLFFSTSVAIKKNMQMTGGRKKGPHPQC